MVVSQRQLNTDSIYTVSLFVIHKLFKIQLLPVFIQAKLRHLHESMQDYYFAEYNILSKKYLDYMYSIWHCVGVFLYVNCWERNSHHILKHSPCSNSEVT